MNDNDLKIEFLGEGALVRSITTPLDIDEALRSKPEGELDICHVEIGKRPRIRGTHIIDFPEPEYEV